MSLITCYRMSCIASFNAAGLLMADTVIEYISSAMEEWEILNTSKFGSLENQTRLSLCLKTRQCPLYNKDKLLIS